MVKEKISGTGCMLKIMLLPLTLSFTKANLVKPIISEGKMNGRIST